MKYSKGIMWLDDCRIPFVDEIENNIVFDRSGKGGYRKELVGCEIKEDYNWKKQQGRFTPNLLVCDDMLNDGNIGGGGKHSGVIKRKRKGYKLNPNSDNLHSTSPDNYGDKGTNSRYYDLDKWFDKVIDEIQ